MVEELFIVFKEHAELSHIKGEWHDPQHHTQKLSHVFFFTDGEIGCDSSVEKLSETFAEYCKTWSPL